MGCCVTRNKTLEGDADILGGDELPTYENISRIYNDYQLPYPIDDYMTHKKEKLIFMIINLLRVKPKIFLQQMRSLKVKCEKRQKPKSIVFFGNDVEIAIDMLRNTQSTHPLVMSE